MSVLRPAPSPIQRSLLRRSLSQLTAGGRGTSCADCGRVPLTGERAHFYGVRLVCELCRPLRRRDPDRSDIVHSSEHNLTVRRI